MPQHVTCPCSSPLNISELDIIISSLYISLREDVVLYVAPEWFGSTWARHLWESFVVRKSGVRFLCVHSGGRDMGVEFN
jgi:hypothetical protein